jgi:hypothetical protein
MFRLYPPLNGPDAPEVLPEDESIMADYAISNDSVYVGFAWSRAASAYEHVFRLAGEHQLGFFDVSSSRSAVWLPNSSGLKLAHQDRSPSLVDRARRFFGASTKLP